MTAQTPEPGWLNAPAQAETITEPAMRQWIATLSVPGVTKCHVSQLTANKLVSVPGGIDAVGGGRRYSLTIGGRVIADLDWNSSEENRANSECLAHCWNHFNSLINALKCIADADYGTDTPKLRETARAAIAKATT